MLGGKDLQETTCFCVCYVQWSIQEPESSGTIKYKTAVTFMLCAFLYQAVNEKQQQKNTVI